MTKSLATISLNSHYILLFINDGDYFTRDLVTVSLSGKGPVHTRDNWQKGFGHFPEVPEDDFRLAVVVVSSGVVGMVRDEEGVERVEESERPIVDGDRG